MLTEKDYCDYETSRELKELGFVAGLGEDNCGHCLYDEAWHDQVDRPLLYEAQKWLREEWGVHITIHYVYHLNEHIFGTTLRFMGKTLRDSGALYDTAKYSSYEEALLEGIKEAVKILKEK